jgi:hypothetical protein
VVKFYSILKVLLPNWLFVYLQNYKRLLTLPHDIRTIVKSLKKDDVCLDFGANVGIYSQLFNKKSIFVKFLVINTILLTPSVNTLPILLKSIFININIFSIYILFIFFVLNYIKLFDNKVLKSR